MDTEFDLKIYHHPARTRRTLGLLKDGVVFWEIRPTDDIDFSDAELSSTIAEAQKVLDACKVFAWLLEGTKWLAENDVKK